MLVLARESRGLTQSRLASLLDISQGHLSRIEAGMLPVSATLLTSVARVLSYPPEFFAVTDPILGPGTSEFFHRKRAAVSARLLAQVPAQVNIRRMQIARLLRSVEIDNDHIPEIDPDVFSGSAEDIARAVRATWRLPHGPIEHVTRTIEENGGLVILTDFGTPLLDAVSRYVPGLPPLFFTNRDSPGDRQRMTLAHELGHMVMHHVPRPEMEEQAFRFAAEFLMPVRDIRTELDDLTLDRLVALKLRWKVSMQSLLKRGEGLGKLTPRRARHLWMLIGKAGFRTREPAEADIAAEHPTLLREIVDVYREQFGYTASQLADLLVLHAQEMEAAYGYAPEESRARPRLRLVSDVPA
jgi:Zn-dependent peptidase ImmA (M78 family)/DNA-binding XRE family transcriptional regulator